MDWFTGIIVYLMIWWIVLFAVLPWRAQKPDEHQIGNVASAPDNPRLKQKFMITSAISAVLWVIIYALIHFNVLDFRKMGYDLIGQANAQEIIVEVPCVPLSPHIPDESVSADTQTDAYGREVKGADVEADAFESPERVAVPITVDMAENLGIALPQGQQLEANFGVMEVDTKTGQAFINGQEVTNQYQDFCSKTSYNNDNSLINKEPVIKGERSLINNKKSLINNNPLEPNEVIIEPLDE